MCAADSLALLTAAPCWLGCRCHSAVRFHSKVLVLMRDLCLIEEYCKCCCEQARLKDLEHSLLPRERCTILWSYGKLRCYPGQHLTDLLLAGPTNNIEQYEPVVRVLISQKLFSCVPLMSALPAQSITSAMLCFGEGASRVLLRSQAGSDVKREED